MNDTAMNIAIFELGEIPKELSDRYPDYPKMIAGWLSPSMPEVKFTGVSPVRGDKLPPAEAYDGYIYSGSRHGVYDGLDWIESVKSFIRSVARIRKPQFGICFGHQIIAEAMGGKAVKSDRGWGVGVQTYGLGQMSAGNTKQVPVMVMHQDQVIALPDAAEMIGGNEFCPIGVARYPECILTVQFHPEFNMDYMVDLLDLRGGITIPIERTDAARDSLAQAPEDKLIGDWTADFFRASLDSPVVKVPQSGNSVPGSHHALPL